MGSHLDPTREEWHPRRQHQQLVYRGDRAVIHTFEGIFYANRRSQVIAKEGVSHIRSRCLCSNAVIPASWPCADRLLRASYVAGIYASPCADLGGLRAFAKRAHASQRGQEDKEV